MRRRELLRATAALCCCACVGPAATNTVASVAPTIAPTAPPSPTPTPFSALTSIVYDAHAHPPKTAASDVIGALDRMNAGAAILMGNAPATAVDYARRSNGTVIPFYTVDATAYTDAAFRNMENNLRRYPEIRGIGEMLARHGSRNIKRPADDPFIVRTLELAGRMGLIVNLHHEPSLHPDGRDAGLAEIDRLLTTVPGVPVVWAHLAAAGPVQITPMLLKHKDLYVDLSNRFTGSGNIDTPDGRLAPQWRSIFEQFPDRFLFGSDLVPESPGNSPEGPNMSEIEGVYARERRRLSELNPIAAEKIGALNFKRLLKI